jgi:hypothetical protein
MSTLGAGNRFYQKEKRSNKRPSRIGVCNITDTPRNMKMMSKTLALLKNKPVPFYMTTDSSPKRTCSIAPMTFYILNAHRCRKSDPEMDAKICV